MREETAESQLERFKDRNPSWGELFGALATKTKPYAIGAAVGVTGLFVGVGALTPTDVAQDNAKAAYSQTEQGDRPGNDTAKSLDVFAPQADRPGSVTVKKTDGLVEESASRPRLKLDIDLDRPFAAPVLELDVSNMDVAEQVNDRANGELDAINVIRKAMETGPGFSSPSVSNEAKANAIKEALDLARASGDVSAVQYDGHVFKIGKSLPRTTTFTEIVETLNWKRDTVKAAIEATESMISGLESDDLASTLDGLAELTGIMENYEFVTADEKLAEALVEAMEKQTNEETTQNDDAGSLASSLREVSDSPVERLRQHYGTERPSAGMSI